MLHIGKHSEAGHRIKELEQIIKQKEHEIIDTKIKFAEQFKNIYNLCFINDYNNKYSKISKINEIAADSYSLIIDELYKTKIEDKEYEQKIIELITTDQSNN